MDLAIPQVMLEMKILNITLGEDFNSIFNFELQPSGSNQSALPIELGNNALLNSGSFIYEFLNSRLRANIEFLEQNNRLKVLSNPMVVASNHRETELFIGEERLLTRGFTFNPATIDNGVIISPAYIETETELQDIGITLRLIPKINQDNTVTIELQQESSTVTIGGGTVPVTDGNGNVVSLAIDTVNTSRLEGIVVAKDNLTVAVGGLIRSTKSNTKRKVPLLSEIPIVGRVFTSDIETEEDTETVLLITPRIMKNPSDSETIRRSNNPFYDSYNNNFPYPEEYPNRFIESKNEIEQRQAITERKSQPYPSQHEEVVNSENNVQQPVSRHQLYMEMSQYAADLVRKAPASRSLDSMYRYEPITANADFLLADNRIKATPEFSLNRGGLYITAVKLSNQSNAALPVDYQNVKGQWVASSVELSKLSARNKSNSETYLYLISALPFSQALVN
jgi:general secretion pathway protein D